MQKDVAGVEPEVVAEDVEREDEAEHPIHLKGCGARSLDGCWLLRELRPLLQLTESRAGRCFQPVAERLGA
jgi:hypothetical protein